MLIVNLSQNKSKISNYISDTLLLEMEENLKNDKKIILYLNKRWNFSNFVCSDCWYYYKCKNCDVSLTVHYNPEKLACHTCWSSWLIPKNCKNCNSKNLKKIWVWTKNIEDSLISYFDSYSLDSNNEDKIRNQYLTNDIQTRYKKPNIFRFDLDSTKNKTQKKEALDKLKNANIIIATKMITTGFDFKNIWLIAIILAEQESSFPSYNSQERGYINLKQLIWRGNRMWEKTNIIMQTFIPENEIIKTFTEKNYKDFFIDTLEERKIFKYPPYCEMLVLEYKNKSEKKAMDFMCNLKNKLDILNDSLCVNYSSKKEIILNKKSFKKFNKYHFRIIIKWKDLREFIENIKFEILRNSDLILISD